MTEIKPSFPAVLVRKFGGLLIVTLLVSLIINEIVANLGWVFFFFVLFLFTVYSYLYATNTTLSITKEKITFREWKIFPKIREIPIKMVSDVEKKYDFLDYLLKTVYFGIDTTSGEKGFEIESHLFPEKDVEAFTNTLFREKNEKRL